MTVRAGRGGDKWGLGGGALPAKSKCEEKKGNWFVLGRGAKGGGEERTGELGENANAEGRCSQEMKEDGTNVGGMLGSSWLSKTEG